MNDVINEAMRRKQGWDQFDEEAERAGKAIRTASEFRPHIIKSGKRQTTISRDKI